LECGERRIADIGALIGGCHRSQRVPRLRIAKPIALFGVAVTGYRSGMRDEPQRVEPSSAAASHHGDPVSIRAVGIVVPAHNDESSVARTVRSVLIASRTATRTFGVTCRTVIVADSCSDQTVHQARDALGDLGTVLGVDVGDTERARRLGTDYLLRELSELGHAPDTVWLASTDADAAVATDWIVKQLRAALRGAGAVADIVELANVSEDLELPLDESQGVARSSAPHRDADEQPAAERS
jgi:hypothetical protein